MNEERIAATAEERDEGTERLLDPANRIIDERVEQAVDELIKQGDSPLWLGLARCFPEATGGDEPSGMDDLVSAFRRAAKSWVETNMPPAEERAVKVLQDAGYEATLIHTGGGFMACEVELPDEVGRVLITDTGEFFEDDSNRYAFRVCEFDAEDAGAVERVANDGELVARLVEQMQIENAVTQLAGTNRTPVYRRRYLGQRAEQYVVKHPDGDPAKRISVRRWLDSGEQGNVGEVEIKAVTGELARHDDQRAGSFADVDVHFRAKLTHPSVAMVRQSLGEAGEAFPVPEPPEDRYWLTDAVLTTYAHRIEAIAENCADDEGERVESIELRPATADDRYSLITVGEICWNLVVTGWSHGKPYTMIEAIGASGRSYGRQDGDE